MTAANSGANIPDKNGGFDDILEQCIQDIQSGRRTIDACINQYPNYPELGDLLRLTTAVKAFPHPDMPAAFTTKTQKLLEARLRDRVRVTRPITQPSIWQSFQRAFVFFALILILIGVVGTSVVYASTGTVPGDALYGVKRTTEQARLTFASAASRPAVLYGIADARLTELSTLAERKQAAPTTFVDEILSSVNVALSSQLDNAARTRLMATALGVVQAAKASGTIPSSTADQALAKLAVSNSIYVNQTNVTATATLITSAVTEQSSATPSPTLTNTPLATFTTTQDATQTDNPKQTATATSRVEPTSLQPTALVPPATTTQTSTITPTATMGQGSARLQTGIPKTSTVNGPTAVVVTGLPVVTATVADTATYTLTPEFSATPTASPTVPATATFTDTPTFTPSATSTVVPTIAPTVTATPINTTVPPTATPTGLPAASFKQQPKQITYENCPPEGKDGDPQQNTVVNRVDDGNYQKTEFDALAKLAWPKDAEGKARNQWSKATAEEIGRWEGLPVQVEVFPVKVQDNGPEAQNCGNADHSSWQLWVLGTQGSANDLKNALIIEIAPRIRANHDGWTIDKLNALIGKNAKIRVGGWISFDPAHAGDVGNNRTTLWEIHPVMQIEVQQGDNWQKLEDYQP